MLLALIQNPFAWPSQSIFCSNFLGVFVVVVFSSAFHSQSYQIRKHPMFVDVEPFFYFIFVTFGITKPP